MKISYFESLFLIVFTSVILSACGNPEDFARSDLGDGFFKNKEVIATKTLGTLSERHFAIWLNSSNESVDTTISPGDFRQVDKFDHDYILNSARNFFPDIFISNSSVYKLEGGSIDYYLVRFINNGLQEVIVGFEN